MLKEVYKYAKDNNLTKDKNFKTDRVAAYIHLSEDGTFLGAIPTKNKEVIVRPTYSKSYFNHHANFLIEKAKTVFCCDDAKHDEYMNELAAASDNTRLIYNYLKSQNSEVIKSGKTNKIRISGTNVEIKDTDRVSFRIGDLYIEDDNSWREYFIKRCREIEADEMSKNNEMISVITGEKVVALKTVPNLKTNENITIESALISANKEAFQSYGLEDAFNAAVSDEEMMYINAGLEELFKAEHYNRELGIMHWCKNAEVVDIAGLPHASSVFADTFGRAGDKENKKETADPLKDVKISNALLNFFDEGFQSLSIDKNEIVYISRPVIEKSGAVSRIFFPNVEKVTEEELFENIKKFYTDSEIEVCRFVGESGNKKSVYVNEFLTNIGSILWAIHPNAASNDKLADKSLNRFKSNLIDVIYYGQPLSDRALKQIVVNYDRAVCGNENYARSKNVLFKLLKLALIRKGKGVPKTMDIENTDIGYLCGRLLATYGKIQETANSTVKANVISKFYRGCKKNPLKVINELDSLSLAHLDAIESVGLRVYFEKYLQEIKSKIPEIPQTLSLEEQGMFILGYNMQMNEFYKKKPTDKDEASADSVEQVN